MKILAIGDFHGKFPQKFESLVKKEEIDLVVSVGDYAPFHYRKIWFKYCYGKDKELWEFIGRKKYREYVLEDLRRAEDVLKRLNKLGVPVFTVLGNMDYPSADDILDEEGMYTNSHATMPNYDRKEALAKRMKKYKNIKRLDYKALKFGGYVFIGMRGHSIPGLVKSKSFRRHKAILDKLFKKFKKENKDRKVIFVSHNILNNTKLDRLAISSYKNAVKDLKKKKVRVRKTRHYGSKMARRIVDQQQPLLHIGGHIHEAFGKQKIGKTLCINTGGVPEGHGAIIELDDKKGKINSVKLL